jgi:hypothetical protein
VVFTVPDRRAPAKPAGHRLYKLDARRRPELVRDAIQAGVNGPFGPHLAGSMGPPGPCCQGFGRAYGRSTFRRRGGDPYLGTKAL